MLLIGLWVAVLMPGLIRAHRQTSPATTVSRFHESMHRLERTRHATLGGDDPDASEVTVFWERPDQDGTSPLQAWIAERVEAVRSWSTGTAPRRAPQPPQAAQAPQAPQAPRRLSPAARRRRVLLVLAVVTLSGVVLAPFTEAFGVRVLSTGVTALAAYVALLWRMQRQRTLHERVHVLGGHQAATATDVEDSAPQAAVGQHPR
jgi:hypothetical protein